MEQVLCFILFVVVLCCNVVVKEGRKKEHRVSDGGGGMTTSATTSVLWEELMLKVKWSGSILFASAATTLWVNSDIEFVS